MNKTLRIFFGLAGLWLAGVPGLRAAERPNFVWLISEDNSKHFLKLFDERGAETPNIERLAKRGILYEHAFSNAPVCSVARTTLITGCYAPRIGTQYHRRSTEAPMPEGLRMFPAYLREGGYYAVNNRKKDYNAVEGEGVWDESSGKAHWRGRKEGQPFFYKQSFTTTHESSLHFPASSMEKETTVTDPDTMMLAPYHPDTPAFRYTYARYHDRIREMDGEIGKVVSQLEQEGLLEDTFIFYFGDHGGVLPRGKGYAYESGLHVPLVVRIPANFEHLVDAKPGTRARGFVSFVDFGPTLLNLAGLRVPEGMDGKPFLGPNVGWNEVEGRNEAFGYADRFDEKYDLVRALRVGDLTYQRSYQPFNPDGLHNDYRYRMLAYEEWRNLFRQGRLDPVQAQFFLPREPEALYDLTADPDETRNLASEPGYAEQLGRMRARLGEIVRTLPDLSFYPESFLVEEALENPVGFGQAHLGEIAKLADIADLQLGPYEAVRDGIAAALASVDPWERYWGCIVCTTHGEAAAEFADRAREMAGSDEEPLVRTRAAEFLGLAGLEDPRPAIKAALRASTSEVETNLILNSVAMLQDGVPGYSFAGLSREEVNFWGSHIEQRLAYLNETWDGAKHGN